MKNRNLLRWIIWLLWPKAKRIQAESDWKGGSVFFCPALFCKRHHCWQELCWSDCLRIPPTCGRQPGCVPVTYAKSKALEDVYGFRPMIGVREGLRRFAEWYKEYFKITWKGFLQDFLLTTTKTRKIILYIREKYSIMFVSWTFPNTTAKSGRYG